MRVPSIDLGEFDLDSPVDRAEVSDLIDEAFRRVGCFALSGHDIDDDLIDETRQVTRAFFERPDAYKQRCSPGSGLPYRGWRARSVNAHTPVRMRESFHVGGYDDPTALAEAGYGEELMRLVEPNLWPGRPVRFRRTWTTLYDEMERLGNRLIGLLEPALDLPDGMLAGRFLRHTSHLAALYYPPQFAAGHQQVPRLDAHTDIGALSIIHPQHESSGLQLDRDGEWVELDVRDGELLVVVGEMLARWTNDRWPATRHRVVSLTDRDKALSRMSLVYFQHPDLDADLTPLEACVGAGTARYDTVLAGEWSHSRMTDDDPWI